VLVSTEHESDSQNSKELEKNAPRKRRAPDLYHGPALVGPSTAVKRIEGGGAINITVKAEEATGLVWNPWSTMSD